MHNVKRSVITASVLALLLLLSSCGVAGQPQSAASPSLEKSPNPGVLTQTEKPSAATAAKVTPAQGQNSAKTGYLKGNVMPDFSIKTLDGSTFKLSDQSGNVVFINLFATWCGPCVGEMPDIQKLYEKYGDRVSFIAIDVGGEDAATASAFVKAGKYAFPAADSPNDQFGTYDIQFIPQTFIVGQDGVISYYAAGASNYAAFSAAIEKLLKS